MIEDFAFKTTHLTDETAPEDRLYFFRFPSPFPTFSSKANIPPETEQPPTTKQVSFAPDVKDSDAAGSGSNVPADSPSTRPLDGVIGQLEVYRSGAIRMRLPNGMLLDVNTVTQPSFLQQAVYQDTKERDIVVVGEVNKQFVVSPNVDALLETLQIEEAKSHSFEGLIKMDLA